MLNVWGEILGTHICTVLQAHTSALSFKTGSAQEVYINSTATDGMQRYYRDFYSVNFL